MSSMQDCSFGLRLSENCHLLDFVRTAGLKSLSYLEPQEIELLTWRVPGFKFSITDHSDVNICFHHEQKLLARYIATIRKNVATHSTNIRRQLKVL